MSHDATVDIYISGPYLTRPSMGAWPIYRDGKQVAIKRTRDEAVAWISVKMGTA